jgi:hypothetical protein
MGAYLSSVTGETVMEAASPASAMLPTIIPAGALQGKNFAGFAITIDGVEIPCASSVARVSHIFHATGSPMRVGKTPVVCGRPLVGISGMPVDVRGPVLVPLEVVPIISENPETYPHVTEVLFVDSRGHLHGIRVRALDR